MIKVWAGVDTGKAHHYCVVIDAEGRRDHLLAGGDQLPLIRK